MNPEHPQTTGPVDTIPVTIFAGVLPTHGTVATLGPFLQSIKNGDNAAVIAAVRAAGETEAGKKLKRELTAIIPGKFSHKGDGGLLQHAGLIIFDVDAVGADEVETLRAKALNDPHLIFFFASPSGSGCKIGIAVDPGRPHRDSWNAGSIHVQSRYGIKVGAPGLDTSCKNVNRLCFTSHDPHAIIAPGPVAWIDYPATEAAEPQDSKEQASAPKENVEELLQHIPTRPPYDQWLRVLSAVGSACPDDAVAMLKKWSPEGVEGEYQEKLNYRLEEVRFGTLVRMAKEHGWQPSEAYKRREAGAKTEAENTKLLEELAKVQFGVGPAPTKPVPLLQIGETTVATPGNLLTVSAQAKSGKSALIGAIVASIIAADGAENVLAGVTADSAHQPTDGEVIIHAFP